MEWDAGLVQPYPQQWNSEQPYSEPTGLMKELSKLGASKESTKMVPEWFSDVAQTR